MSTPLLKITRYKILFKKQVVNIMYSELELKKGFVDFGLNQ